MNKNQNAFLQMVAANRTTVIAHTAAWPGFPPFATAWAAFMALQPQVDAAIALQSADSTGTTESKAEVRVVFTKRLLQLGDTMALLGATTGNAQLRADAEMSPSDMHKLTEKALVGHATKLLSLAAANAAALAPLGINAAFLNATGAARDAFVTAMGTPRHVIAESVRGTQDLDRLEDTLRAMYQDRLDPAARVLQYTQPAFWSEYSTSRVILDPGADTRALDVTVIDKATNEPLAGATASIDPSGVTRTSGAAGRFYVQTLAAGTYTLHVSKAGYLPAGEPFTLDAAGGLALTVKLAPGS